VSDSLDRRSPSEPLCGTSLFYFILFCLARSIIANNDVVTRCVLEVDDGGIVTVFPRQEHDFIDEPWPCGHRIESIAILSVEILSQASLRLVNCESLVVCPFDGAANELVMNPVGARAFSAAVGHRFAAAVPPYRILLPGAGGQRHFEHTVLFPPPRAELPREAVLDEA